MLRQSAVSELKVKCWNEEFAISVRDTRRVQGH